VGALSPWLERWGQARRRALQAACGVALAVFVAGGLAINWFGLAYFMDPDELPLLEFVRQHQAEGDTYLLPVEVPKLGSGRSGAISSSFLPPLRRDKGHQLISVDLQRFRLYTGAPIFVDFKSIPYKDVEVLEWYRRLEWAQSAYGQKDWTGTNIPSEITRQDITHVVVPVDRAIRSDALEQVYSDETYRLYRVRRVPTPADHR
jgi:hypothetical protein